MAPDRTQCFNTTLESLDLSFCRSMFECDVVSAAVQANVSLHELGERSLIECPEVVSVLAALQKNTVRRSLDLSHGTLSYEALSALAAGLQANSTLQSLNFARCSVSGWRGPDCPELISRLAALADAMAHHKALTSLDISDALESSKWNTCADKIDFVNILRTSNTLRSLHLVYVTCRATGLWFAAIEQNSTLTELSLEMWQELVHTEAFTKLATLWGTSNSLHHLTIRDWQMTPEETALAEGYLQANTAKIIRF